MAFHLIHADGRSLLASDKPLLRDQERAPITEAVALLDAVRGWHDRQAQALAEAREAVEAAKADQDLLLAHLAELTALEPQAGEEARLAETRADMQKGEKLSGDLDELRHIWEGSDSPLAALRVAARRLDRIAPEHPLLTEALGALDRAVIEAGEAEDKLSAAAEALVHDPAALDAAETRLFELRAIARKHRCEVDELPAKMREMRSRLESIEGGEAQLDALEAAAKDAGQRYRAEAEALLSDADALAAQGRYGEAVRLLLARSIGQIANRRPDLVHPSSTARELSRLDALPDAGRRAFAAIARSVERALFALEDLTERDWNEARAAYADFALERG